jgi:hypothetical protein
MPTWRRTATRCLPAIAAYNLVDRLPDELPPVNCPRLPRHRPPPEENRHGAWYINTEIAGAAAGKLAGKRVALKDNICLARAPMINGASTMEGYVPEVDATVVARILDAGGITDRGVSMFRRQIMRGINNTVVRLPEAANAATDRAIMRRTGLRLAQGYLKQPPLSNGA